MIKNVIKALLISILLISCSEDSHYIEQKFVYGSENNMNIATCIYQKDGSICKYKSYAKCNFENVDSVLSAEKIKGERVLEILNKLNKD